MIIFFDIYQNIISIVQLDDFFFNDNFFNNFFSLKTNNYCCSSKFKFNINLVLTKFYFYKIDYFNKINVIVYK